MGRLLDALKRLEPELQAMQLANPIAQVDSLPDAAHCVNQTAVLEPPAEWQDDLPAMIDHQDDYSQPAEADSNSVSEEQAVEYLANEEMETDCNLFQGEQATNSPFFDNIEADCSPINEAKAVEYQPYAEVSAEIDSLSRLLDEELPPRETIETDTTHDPGESASVIVAETPVVLFEQAIDERPEAVEEPVVFLEHAESDHEPCIFVDESEVENDSKILTDRPETKKDHGAFAEMARNLLAQLPVEGSAALFFTSPTDGEGKTETILPLAEALIEESGRRTILVDANLHHPDLTREWRFSSRKGIFDVLTGEADWWDAVQETGLPKLSILLNNGLSQPNAIVSQPLAFSELLENLKREYRLVLIDAASLAHAESIPMVRHCQGVYLVVRLGHSNRRTVREARDVIAQAGGKLLGCIAVGDVLEPA